MTGSTTAQSEVGRLRRVLLKHARDAFVSQERIEAQWRSLNFAGAPDFDDACREYDAFAELLTSFGAEVEWLPPADSGLDSIYVRDPAVVTDRCVLLCRMGKEARRQEGAHQLRAFEDLGIGPVVSLEEPATLEGGDVCWLADGKAAVGRGYRSNAAGVSRLTQLLGPDGVIEVPMPHWNGPGDVLHVMSAVSPLAQDLVLVYPRILPVPFLEYLRDTGVRIIEVPDEEFDTQGCNVLAVAPGVVVVLEGNPRTRRLLEAAGVEVHAYEGEEISAKGSGGPTCLTRPLARDT